ncbi:non-homologous end joining protein Ku [Rhizobium tibeticum]|nr:non-homologous end joining protein Ku [Rhizobium tibeticum]
MQQLIKQKTARWSPIIEEKKKLLKPKKTSNVVNIMEALRKSVEADLKNRKAV